MSDMLSCLFIEALWSPAGKGLTSWLLLVMFSCVCFVDPFCYLCFMSFMLSCLFIAASWSPAGKANLLALLYVMFSCVFDTFPCGVLGQVRYLIVSIPDLCLLPLLHLYM